MRLPRLQKTSGGSDLFGSSRTDDRVNTGCIFVAVSTFLMSLLSFLLNVLLSSFPNLYYSRLKLRSKNELKTVFVVKMLFMYEYTKVKNVVVAKAATCEV